MNLFKLHNCNAKFDNNFNVFDTFYHYFDLLKDKNKFLFLIVILRIFIIFLLNYQINMSFIQVT